MQDFKEALGQYLLYRVYLEEKGFKRSVFLAIDDETYFQFFQWKAVQLVVHRFQIALLMSTSKKRRLWNGKAESISGSD
jgi:hypothetical protein